MKALQHDPLTDPLLTTKELARVLKVSSRTVWRWLALKRLPEPIRYSRSCIRWRTSTIQAYLDDLADNAQR
jgi:excisionase family DNA binding protein